MKPGGMLTVVLGCAALAAGAPVRRTEQGNSAMQHHHSCQQEERASIERGEGFGMAMPADLAGYPGPRHVLDMAKDLGLTAEQKAGVEKIYEAMHEKAVARGKELFEAEARLEQMFREGRPEADLREQSFRVDSIHAELRWIHLSAHLAAQKLLTAEQIAKYTRLRHEQM
ncbi:MAG TPA: Spy/CpxP family protein refolding chaperone [Candidatus Acidoferrales bacterium]|nr:Spy/CpxP family protein refolding chaperone [Candidatus Acidoferrales bacterium]